VIINESNIADIQAEYDGPAGTPFEGGLFRMKLVLGSDFPNAPPKGKLRASVHSTTEHIDALHGQIRDVCTCSLHFPDVLSPP
jgi:ubiquitin-protein ligase